MVVNLQKRFQKEKKTENYLTLIPLNRDSKFTRTIEKNTNHFFN